jgi:glycyl-tRNA synthetase beta chain
VRDGAGEGVETVRRGNEWVVEPRLEDAEFYLHEDMKTPFAERVEMLRRVTFLAGLGMLYRKTERLEALARWFAVMSVAKAKIAPNPPVLRAAERAARLSKCDLTTMMIGDSKLGELQGVIGAEYARLSGEPEDVAQAIGEQYLPKGADGKLPASDAGRLLATVDRFDNLVACYALGMRPSGSADPLALRRQMQGLAAIAVDGGMRYDFEEAVGEVYDWVAMDAEEGLARKADVVDGLRDLANQRMQAALQDAGVRYDIARAVTSAGWGDFVEAWGRALLLKRKVDDPEWEHVVLSGQRISNILRPVRDQVPAELGPEAFVEPQEIALYEAAKAADEAMRVAADEGDTERLWEEVVKLAPVIDALFDNVMVMAEDEGVRRNRLALLAYVEKVLYRLADFREVVLA